MKAMQIRPPAVSGLFYPADPTLLALNVDGMLEAQAVEAEQIAGRDLTTPPRAIIVPHAGYAYSGPTAAAAYARLRGHAFRTAVIVSPSHREYFSGISVYDGDAYRTPLGLINVDVELRERLLMQFKGVIRQSQLGHRDEHAVEVHLPFIQRINPEAKILPIVMGDQRGEYCSILGKALARIADHDGVLLIASSDLSHFHQQEEAQELDNVVANHVREIQPAKLLDDIAAKRCEACGGGPIAAVLSACLQLGASNVSILHQCTSGDISGDTRRVVGYLSAAIAADTAGRRP